jgi:two-component system sensor histidine kinase UhpB
MEREIAADVRLAAEVEVVVYRVAQEAITNALRHSGAERIRVTLAPADGGAELRVIDDGRGRGAEVEGAGLRGMRERAVLAGGVLEVAAPPAGGTCVTLRVP